MGQDRYRRYIEAVTNATPIQRAAVFSRKSAHQTGLGNAHGPVQTCTDLILEFLSRISDKSATMIFEKKIYSTN